MTIPDYQTLMEPVLRVVDRDGILSMRELANKLAAELQLTDEDRKQTIASGMGLLENRAHWAVTYLFKAQAVRRPRRGYVEITERGRALLKSGGPIRNATLEQFSGVSGVLLQVPQAFGQVGPSRAASHWSG